MKREVISLLVIICFILNFNFVCANFEIGDPTNSIQKTYSSSENIKGWINISLDDEQSDSLFSDNHGNSISLIELINQNSQFTKICSSENCDSDYTAENNEDSKIFTLNEGESVLFGFDILGEDISSFSNFFFDLQSTNPESDNVPLTIDILNDGKIEWQAYTGSENFGSENFGCFVDLGDTSLAYITQFPYCEKIKIPKTPEVEIGAYIEGSASINLEMIIKNSNLGITRTCTISVSGEDRISCIPEDFSVTEERDYIVCIKTQNTEDNNKYQIAFEKNEPCGYTEPYKGEYVNDFEIFVRAKKYTSSIDITLNDAELDNSGSYLRNIERYVENYIEESYDNDCSAGCPIQIKLSSGVNQEITISNANLYYFSEGISTSVHQVYDILEVAGKISTPENNKFQRLYLDDANFSIPEELGNYSFILNFGEEEIASKEIFIEETPSIQSLKPLYTATAYPTEFEVIIDSKKNITSYEWDFGENKTKKTFTNKINYTYTSKGNYNVKITILDDQGNEYSNTFKISVESPKEIINNLLKKMLKDISQVKSDIEELSFFEKKYIEDSLKLEDLEKNLEEIQQENASASSETDYNNLMAKILALDLPESISKTISADSILYYSDIDKINLGIVESITKETVSANKEEQYKDAIVTWGFNNIETKINFRELSAKYELYDKPLVRLFEMEITNEDDNVNPYLVINLDNIQFYEDYGEKNQSGYTYIKLNNPETKIIFATQEEVDFINLPMFISPSINELSLVEIEPEKNEELFKLAIFVLVIFLLVIFGVIAYIILQEWYKRKYESYLFKSKNDLYNLISYVQASKDKELNNSEIRSNLQKTGWKKEQINYVMKKYSGKRTGMFEIPINKLLNMFKRKDKSLGTNSNKIL